MYFESSEVKNSAAFDYHREIHHGDLGWAVDAKAAVAVVEIVMHLRPARSGTDRV